MDKYLEYINDMLRCNKRESERQTETRNLLIMRTILKQVWKT